MKKHQWKRLAKFYKNLYEKTNKLLELPTTESLLKNSINKHKQAMADNTLENTKLLNRITTNDRKEEDHF